MALWQIGDRAPGEHGAAVEPDSLAGSTPIFVHSKEDGTNAVINPSDKSDPYGGVPISVNVGNSASGLDGFSGVLSSGFSGLFDLIERNTDKNNAWSAAQAEKQMSFQERMNQIAQEFNAGEAAKNRSWQEYMSNTAHQREVADLKAAGLNPVLSASGGNGASVGSGSAASISSPTGAKGDTDTSANTALVSLYGALINAQTQMANANLAAKTNMYMADRQVEASMYGAQLAANANMYGSQMAYNASTYNADKSFENNEAQRNWNAAHPTNVTQALTGAINDGGNTGSAKQNVLSSIVKTVGKALAGVSVEGSWMKNHFG